jgi:flavin-dependent dehydrogenase
MRANASACDVAVVGAGPAGIAAAEALVVGGARVVVIERHARPGGKACGGGLTAGAWERASVDPASPPPFGRAFDALEVHSPLGRRRLRSGGPLMVVVDRRAWQALRLARLEEMGAVVRLGERALGLEAGCVTTERGRIGCGHVVGADGASSRMRRLLGLEPGPGVRALQIAVARSQAPGVDPDVPAVWFDPRRLGLGYGWAFPTADGTIRLGAGAAARSVSAERLGRGFRDWLAAIGVDAGRAAVASGTIRCGYAGHRFGRVRLAGDAAGLASPVTGEGIAQALASGAEVAREILEPEYRSPIIEALAVRHRRTHELLAVPYLGAALFALAPPLLGIRAIREAALRRYA